jgi:hypothetical protein
MTRELSSDQRGALHELVADGTLSADQLAAVLDRLHTAGAGHDRRGGWVVEAGGYLGGALTFAGATLLVGLSWDELSRPGQVVVLAAVTVTLLAAGVLIAGGASALRAMAGAAGTVRSRVVSVLFALACGAAALAVGVGVTSHEAVAAGMAGLVLAAVVHRVLPSLPVLLVAAVLSVVAATATAGDLLDGGPLATGLSMVLVGAGWIALGLSGALTHRGTATIVGAVIGLTGAQLPLGSSATAPWAYLLTLLVAAGCLAAYTPDRNLPLLLLGVLGITLVLTEAVADWTGGASGGAAAVLTAGIALLIGTGLALRLHRGHRPGHTTAGALPRRTHHSA